MSTISRDQLLFALSMRRGAENGIHARELVTEIAGRCTPGLERELRNIVEALRREGHHICALPKSGYFIAATAEELLQTVGFLHDRAMCSLSQAAAMQNVALPDLRGQLRLPS